MVAALSVVSLGTLARARRRPDSRLSKISVCTIFRELVLPRGRIVCINVGVERDTVRLHHQAEGGDREILFEHHNLKNYCFFAKDPLFKNKNMCLETFQNR